MNDNDQLIRERCMAFCALLVEKALEHPIPEQVVDSVFNLMLAKAEGKKANDDDLANLHSALVGFCGGSGFLAHYDKHVVDYMSSVMAIIEIAALEIALEESEDNND